MKKNLLLLFILFISIPVLFAQKLDLGGVDTPDVSTPDVEVPEVEVPEVEVPEIEMPDTENYPVGKWLDANYNAIWSFSSGNIILYTTEGELVFDFKDKMKGFDLSGNTKGVTISFSCEETDRAYEFVKGVVNKDMTLIIDKGNGVHYETVMKMQ